MISALKSMSAKPKASASVVDGKLILSFPFAQTPVLWQMDLAQAKASAIEVLKTEKGNDFTLTLKTQKGEKVEIATFDNREDALDGLMAASDALKNAHGNISMAANQDQKIAIAHAPHAKPSTILKRILFIATFALVVLFGLWGTVAPRSPSSIQTSTQNSASAVQQNGATASESAGVPVSADDFLNGL